MSPALGFYREKCASDVWSGRVEVAVGELANTRRDCWGEACVSHIGPRGGRSCTERGEVRGILIARVHIVGATVQARAFRKGSCLYIHGSF